MAEIVVSVLEKDAEIKEVIKGNVELINIIIRNLKGLQSKLSPHPKLMWENVGESLFITCKKELNPLFKQLYETLHAKYLTVGTCSEKNNNNSNSDHACVIYYCKQQHQNDDVVDIRQHAFMWQITLREAIYMAAFAYFIKEFQLISIEQVKEIVGFKEIDVEDYIWGISSLPNELARLSCKCVIDNDFETPVKIRDFLNQLYSGFRLLNLKNDGLRRRVDSIKYDCQRAEEIVFNSTHHHNNNNNNNNNNHSNKKLKINSNEND